VAAGKSEESSLFRFLGTLMRTEEGATPKRSLLSSIAPAISAAAAAALTGSAMIKKVRGWAKFLTLGATKIYLSAGHFKKIFIGV
jgi:hypothetical protein